MKNLILSLSILTLALTGCSGSQKQETPRDKLHTQWNNARGGVLYGLAKQQFEGGNLTDARKSLDEAIRLQPENVSLRILSARVLIEQGKLDNAVRELENVRAIDPANAEADYLMGVIQQRWQKPETALKWYVQATDKKPNELAYVMARAETLVVLGREDEALGYIQERLTFFESAAPIRDLAGQLLLWSGKATEAAAILREASMLMPEDEQIREHLALALYRAGQYPEAITVLEKLMRIERCAKRVDLRLALGESLLKTARPDDARAIFQELAQEQPVHAHFWVSLAKAGLACDDTERADLSIRKAIALDSANTECWLLMGYLRVRQNRMDEALAAFQKALTIDPSESVALCMQGYVLEKQGKSRQALDSYAKALQIRPGDELATSLLAHVQAHD